MKTKEDNLWVYKSKVTDDIQIKQLTPYGYSLRMENQKLSKQVLVSVSLIVKKRQKKYGNPQVQNI